MAQDAAEKQPRLTLSELMALPREEMLRHLEKYPLRGASQEEDPPEEEDELDEDGNPTGNKKGDKPDDKDKKGSGKTYTKEELDEIVEKAVKDRLDRQKRSADRKKAEEEGDKDGIIADLKKEIEDDLKPKADRAEKAEAELERYKGVVTAQIVATLKTLPQELQDLDLGDDVDPVKRLEWLVTKVVPKASSGEQNKDEGNPPRKRGGNGPGPNPEKPKGDDPKKKVDPVLSKRRF